MVETPQKMVEVSLSRYDIDGSTISEVVTYLERIKEALPKGIEEPLLDVSVYDNYGDTEVQFSMLYWIDKTPEEIEADRITEENRKKISIKHYEEMIKKLKGE